MDVETLQPRVAAGVGLLALIPTLWYALGRPDTAGFVAAVNVVIIFAALWITMSPLDGGDHGEEHHDGTSA